MRFRAEQHLRRPGDIRGVRESGRRVECQAFTVWWRRRDGTANPTPDSSRVCVIASTAAVGNAVKRNRAKRRLRELYRSRQANLPRDCDLLLIARKIAVDCSLELLNTRFDDACRKIAEAPR